MASAGALADGTRPGVVIAGGGIGGLATALALARRGIASHVLERRPAWSEAGAGIQLSPNAVRALRHLGVGADLEALAGVPRALVVRAAGDGRVLQRLPLGDWIAQRHGAPYWQVHRRDLQAVLVAAVAREPRIAVSLGETVVGFAANDDGIWVKTGSGQRISARLLVGADGVFSNVRNGFLPQSPPVYSGRIAARTVIARAQLPAVRDGSGQPLIDPDTTGVWLAPGSHVVHYPVRGGSDLAVVVVRTDPVGPQGWSMPVDAADIENAVLASAPALAGALGSGHVWRQWALYEAGPYRRWSQDGVTLLGDAAHPTLPFMAQGGAMALEDAVVLAHFMAQAADGGSIGQAVARYEALRQPRTAAIVAAARRNGRIFHLSGLAARARDAGMRILPADRVMAGYDWIYGWQPPLDNG
ncbi:MAG: FAD-dependent monooxygenase [Hyphomicrobiaceae bacterium]